MNLVIRGSDLLPLLQRSLRRCLAQLGREARDALVRAVGRRLAEDAGVVQHRHEADVVHQEQEQADLEKHGERVKTLQCI